MIKCRYYLFIILLLGFACNKSDTNNALPTDDNNEGDTLSEWAVKPMNTTFPQALFTDPRLVKQGKPSKAIIGFLAGLINATPKGSSMHMSIYLFEEEYGLISAIRKANNRGVNIHVMLDRSERSSNTPTVNKLLAINKNMDIVGIHNDANSSAINHNKFVLFSNLSTKNGTVKNVVFTSSENWVPFTEEEIQNAVVLSNEGLYNAYLQYWKDMKSHADKGMANFQFRTFDALNKDGIMAIFYPKRKDGAYFGPDPIVHILDQITDPAITTIQIEMPFWTQGRIGILTKLSNLMDQGAKVEMVVRSNVGVYDELVDLADKGAYVKMYDYSDVAGIKRIELHSKVMMIHGEWRGHKTDLIITGSENFTANALKYNNENNILLSSYYFKHPEIFKRFEDNFNKIKVLPGVCCLVNND